MPHRFPRKRSHQSGTLALSVGSLYDIVRTGYKTKLPAILRKFYESNHQEFDPEEIRPFDRDYYYSFRKKKTGGRFTPMLIGGDYDRYIWGIPLRCLLGQTMATDLLELAEQRKKDDARGKSPAHLHTGVEVIFVIHGNVTIHVKVSKLRPPLPPIKLSAENFIHLNSTNQHFIENNDPNAPALLLIVRVP